MTSTQPVRVKGIKKRAAPGRPRKYTSVTDWARAQGSVVLKPVVGLLARMGLHPNTVTLVGMVLQVGVGVVFGLGHLLLGGWLLLIVAPLDALDGLLARTAGQQSRFGAFLDSTLDRVSDAALILGLTVHYWRQGAHLQVGLLLVSLVAAMMVSYVRARAEAVGFACKVGLLTRFGRIIVIGLFSAVGLHALMIWVLAVFSVFTVIQRILHVYAVARREDEGR